MKPNICRSGYTVSAFMLSSIQESSESIIVSGFLWHTEHRELDHSEILFVFPYHISIRFSHHIRIIHKSTAAKSTENKSINLICDRCMQDKVQNHPPVLYGIASAIVPPLQSVKKAQ